MNDIDLSNAIAARRLAAEWLLRWAVDDAVGVTEWHPRYRRITESRDWIGSPVSGHPDPDYSSCGDLPHWLLKRVGIGLPMVNRKESGTYRERWNITRLTQLATGKLGAADLLLPGDILVVWNHPNTDDAHAVCVLQHSPPELQTAEYGQPGGALRRHTLLQTPGGLQLGTKGKPGGKRVQVWISLARIIEQAAALHYLQPVDMAALEVAAPGEVCDEVARLGAASLLAIS